MVLVKQIDRLEIGMVIKSEVYEMKGIISKIWNVYQGQAYDAVNEYIMFEVTWENGRKSQKYHHESAFEVI